METKEITKSDIQNWFIKNKLTKKLSQNKESSFWNDFLSCHPINGKYYESNEYFFYYVRFWSQKVELRYWKKSGRVSSVENSKKFTVI